MMFRKHGAAVRAGMLASGMLERESKSSPGVDRAIWPSPQVPTQLKNALHLGFGLVLDSKTTAGDSPSRLVTRIQLRPRIIQFFRHVRPCPSPGLQNSSALPNSSLRRNFCQCTKNLKRKKKIAKKMRNVRGRLRPAAPAHSSQSSFSLGVHSTVSRVARHAAALFYINYCLCRRHFDNFGILCGFSS